MPNINVPSFPVCQRLAKAWRCADAHWAYDTSGGLRCNLGFSEWTPAPTCAEMLAEIQRRSWGISLHRACGNGYWTCYVNYRVGQQAVAHNGQSPTETLALALAEGLENEGART